MSKPARPFITPKRVDSNTFQLTLNPACGLPQRVCNEWKRRSFQDLPDEFAHLRVPKTKAAAQAAAFALVAYLKKKMEEEGSARRIVVEDITVGAWIEKFTTIETSPRTGVNASRNRPYSTDTLQNYESYFRLYIKEDPIGRLKMAEVEEQDVLEYMARLSVTKLEDGRQMGGTRTYAGVVGFMRMTFRDYQKKNRRWYNPFLYIDAPQYTYTHRDALPEDEILKLFAPGVLKRTIELGVCAAMFLSGLRRAEVAALKPEDLDWKTPKINIRHAWQNFDNKEKRVLGPPKSKHYREAPFDPILQAAITKLWEENGKHKFVFSHKNGKPIGPSWTRFNFNRWLERAGIELDGREIVPHSSRHSLATLLEEKGVSLRHIQELLGHSDLETTKGYLHTNRKTLLKISQAISEVMESETEETQPERSNILGFKVS